MPFIAFLFLCTFLSWTFADVDYESDILPLFEDYCYDCHGPDKQKSGFRTDKRAHLLKGGDSGLAALIPGDPRRSYLMEVITSDDPEISMPPKGGKLFEDEIERFSNKIIALNDAKSKLEDNEKYEQAEKVDEKIKSTEELKMLAEASLTSLKKNTALTNLKQVNNAHH